MRMKRGFTLAEILVVVAIIGAIAIGLLAAADPFEQLKKGRDTAMINRSNDVYTAIIRYSATTGRSPIAVDVEGVSLNSANGVNVTNALIRVGELKQTFSTLFNADLSELFFTGKSDLSYFTVCYLPKSKGQKTSPRAIYDKYGIPTDCHENDCYICTGTEASPTQIAELKEKIRTCKQANAECEINNSEMACCSGLQCIVYNDQSGAGKCDTIPIISVSPTAPVVSPTSTSIPTPTSTPLPTFTPTPTPLSTFCSDTDNGSYDIAGSCTDSFGTYTDYCDGTTAREMYCSGTWKNYWIERHCGNGGYVCSSSGKLCQNGACVSP